MNLQKTIRQNGVFLFFPISMASNSIHGILLTLLFLNSWYLMGLLDSFGCSARSWQVKNTVTRGVSKTIWHVSIVFFRWTWTFVQTFFSEILLLIRGFTYFLRSPRFVVRWSNLTVAYFFKMGSGKKTTYKNSRFFVCWLVFQPKVTKRHLTFHRRHFGLVEFIHVGVGDLAIEVTTVRWLSLKVGGDSEFW